MLNAKISGPIQGTLSRNPIAFDLRFGLDSSRATKLAHCRASPYLHPCPHLRPSLRQLLSVGRRGSGTCTHSIMAAAAEAFEDLPIACADRWRRERSADGIHSYT